MSWFNGSSVKQGLLGLAIMSAGILLVAPAADARVGIGLNLAIPPVVAPPPVVVAPPPYYAPPPAYYYPPPYYYAPAPGYGFFSYDRFGHRHWRH